MPTTARLALLFDFDGTLYVGDLPILAYARHCAALLADDAATSLIDGVRFFLEGKAIGEVAVDLSAAEDGYQTVEILAGAAGLTADQINSCYRLARADLATSAFALEAPEGLVELLQSLRGVHVMVVTNADSAGVTEVLDAIGLTKYTDELITDAGKPGSMAEIISTTLRRIDATDQPQRLMVVGDRWLNDLADAFAAGALTAAIDRFGRHEGTPSLRAADLSDLLPEIRYWAEQHGGLA